MFWTQLLRRLRGRGAPRICLAQPPAPAESGWYPSTYGPDGVCPPLNQPRTFSTMRHRRRRPLLGVEEEHGPGPISSPSSNLPRRGFGGWYPERSRQ